MAVEKEQIQELPDIESSELKNFIDNIDVEVLAAVKELILQVEQNHNRVHVTGTDRPGYAAEHTASLLSSAGAPAYELHGTKAVHGSVEQVPSEDVVTAISNSGGTTELKTTAEMPKSNDAELIALAGKTSSWLTKQEDVILITGISQEGDAMNKPPKVPISVEMVILQSLSISLQNTKNLTPQQHMKWHPGGDLDASIKESGDRQMKLERIITPIVIPFHHDEEQNINYEATKQLIDHLAAKGIKGISILGSNREFHVIEKAEKTEFTEKVIRMIDHHMSVYVGTGVCNTKETIHLSEKMEELDVDVLSVITPYSLMPTEEGLVWHSIAAAEDVGIPIIFHNIPKVTGCNPSAEIVGCLVEVENVRDIKDSSGKEENLKVYAEPAKRDDFDLLIGSDSKINYGYALGVSGTVAGTSNVITEVLAELDRVLRKGEAERAEELRKDVNVLRDVLKLGMVPVIMKRAAELAGIVEIGPVGKPILECSAQDDEEIKEMLQYYHLI